MNVKYCIGFYQKFLQNKFCAKSILRNTNIPIIVS